MSFPVTPTNGQTTVTNGISYIYNATSNAWFRQTTVLNLSTASTTSGTAASGTGTTSTFVISNTSQSTSTTTGALQVAGGVGIGGNLNVGGSVTIAGLTTFNSPVIFNSTASYIFSTNTFYTDNILELHTPPGGIGSQWATDDGKDIGLRFHYYNRSLSTDSNAALVLADDSQSLEWYATGSENSSGDFTGTVTYGTFKTGVIKLVGGNTSTNTTTGDLQIIGGVGIGGSVNIGGTVTGGGIRSTTSITPPSNPTVGDIWYQQGTDVVLRYENDGTTTTSYWVDITGPTVIISSGTVSGSLGGGGTFTGGTVTNTTTFINPVIIGTNSTSSVGLVIGTTDAVQLPVGSTAQRPLAPNPGMLRYNSSGTYGLEVYVQSSTSSYSGTWTSIVAPIYSISYLVIAGGGSGGSGISGGGGAGGLLQGNTSVISGQQYQVVVGGGGASTYGLPSSNGLQGANSTISALGITAIGGGAGGAGGSPGGTSGGSGGGERYTSSNAGTPGQGYSSGPGISAATASGGGGAGGPGQTATPTAGGNGGTGTLVTIAGTSTYYAGGGGGGGYVTLGYPGGNGGLGGGSAGTSGSNASNATANTGGGGGGGGYNSPGPGTSYTGGQGGSGLVIITYASVNARASGGTVSSYPSGPNTIWVHTFTTSSVYIA